MLIVLQCADKDGLMAAIFRSLAKGGLNITILQGHVDNTENLVFIRLEIDKDDGTTNYSCRSLS